MSRRYDPAVEWEREQRRLAAEQRRREAETRRQEREQQRAHVEKRQRDAEAQNDDLDERVDELGQLLTDGLEDSGSLEFESLKEPLKIPEFDPQGADVPAAGPRLESFLPEPPGFFARLVPGRMDAHRTAVAEGERMYTTALAAYGVSEKQRTARFDALRMEHARRRAELTAKNTEQHAEIDRFAQDYREAKPEAVVRFFEIALGRDAIPESFPAIYRLAYVAESKQLVVERELPAGDVIPVVSGYRYVRSRDAVETSARPQSQAVAGGDDRPQPLRQHDRSFDRACHPTLFAHRARGHRSIPRDRTCQGRSTCLPEGSERAGLAKSS